MFFEDMSNLRPKPPHNAFMLFCEKYREEVKKNIIALNMKSNHRQVAPPKDVARNLGERWRNADETSKKEFVDRFSKAYEKYKVDLSTWKSENEVKNKGLDTYRVEDSRKKCRRFVDPNKPRPPHNPFMRFCEVFRNIVRDQILDEIVGEPKVAPPKEVARRLGERWRNANDSEKAEFQKSFSEDYHQYRKLLDIYKKKVRSHSLLSSTRKRKIEADTFGGRGRKKRPYRTDPRKPKPPHNAFMLFCSKFRGIVKTEILEEKVNKPGNSIAPIAPPKEVARRLGKRWREANQSEKMEFLRCFKEKYAVYKDDLCHYSNTR